ncbi:tetratricopeptide repeat protein [Spirosoma sp. BT702]|uniref:Tetratricopeptide repeat protein n=1 Tax=Spirosoma profusum TaxID=2771354 RepID=A0A926XWS6_9BACT|nr:tetratricopeptide repeat protein [Spirosoma profusum]MBD2701416.1 tetratricopeptide repeat protein [Spirosoma profusum]
MKHIIISLVLAIFCLTPLFAQQAKSALQAVHYIKLANTLREVDKSQESISLLLRAMPAVQSKNLYWEAVANELLGLSYNDIKDTATAIRYLELARTQYTKLKYVASGWGVNEIIRNISGKNVYAGIQVSKTAVRVAIFKTKYESDFYEKEIKTTFDIPNSPLLYANASNAITPGRDALRVGLDSISRYNIPSERIFIVFSSDLDDDLGQTPLRQQALYQQLSRVLPNTTLRIDTTLTPAREAELFTIGTLPRKVWPTTSALNLGSTQTMGGYFDREASRRNYTGANKSFHAVTIPIGITTLVSRIEGKRSSNMDAFRREAQRIVKNVADSVLSPYQSNRDLSLQQRSTVGLGGDITQALVAYLYPDKANLAAVPISIEDVERFKRAVLTDYKSLIQPDLRSITNPDLRNRAEKDVTTAQNQLNEKQLITGALWLSALVTAYHSEASPKRFVFVRNAGISWVTGKFLETINYEYESTIAKGAMYTR